MFRYTLVLLLLFVTACSTDEPAGSGSIDGFDLGVMFELDLENLQSQDGVDSGLLSQVAQLVSDAAPHVDSIRLYTAATVIDEEFQDVEIGAVRFSGDLAGAEAAVIVDASGLVKSFRVWGLEDETADWENFWRQFEYKNTRRLVAAIPANSDSAAASFQETLDSASDPELRFVANAYRHIVLMRSNSQVVRTTMALTSLDETPTVEFYESYIKQMAELAGLARDFEPVIGGAAVEEYLRVVDDATVSLNAIAELANDGNVKGTRNAIMDYRRRTCGACHGIESHTLDEGELDDALLAHFDANGIHRDWYKVGLDVWPVPGSSDTSQTIASTLKAMLMLMNN